MIQNESRDPNGGNVFYVTMQITFVMRKFWNVDRNLHCDVVDITTFWVSSLTLDYNGVFAIMAYDALVVLIPLNSMPTLLLKSIQQSRLSLFSYTVFVQRMQNLRRVPTTELFVFGTSCDVMKRGFSEVCQADTMLALTVL